MTLLPSEILLVAAEIATVLAGRPVQKVIQPDERSVVLGFAGAWLLITLDRRHGRIHLLDGKPEGRGEAAPAFCMLLRKELLHLRLDSVEPVVGERVLELVFAARGKEPATHRRLRIFLYGAGARMLLLDDEDRVLGALPHSSKPTDELIALPPPRTDENRPSRFTAQDASQEIAAFYGRSDADEALSVARSEAVAQARRSLDKLRRLEIALSRDLERMVAALSRRRHADLLLAHLAEIPRGAKEITLADDFEDGRPLTIPLDPARSPKDNVARLYHELKRLGRGRAVVEARLAETASARARAEALVDAITTADPFELGALSARVPVAKTQVRKAQKFERVAIPYRVFRSTSGAEIFVGKGADKNDQLTFKVARGNDLWLHTRDMPGAHVVVPLAGSPIDELTLIDAAILAVYFSPARPKDAQSGSGPAQIAQADVTYALRKFVKKPRNATPGRVSVAGGKTLRVRLDPERLRQLLSSRVDE